MANARSQANTATPSDEDNTSYTYLELVAEVKKLFPVTYQAVESYSHGGFHDHNIKKLSYELKGGGTKRR